MPNKTIRYLLSALCGLLVINSVLFAQPEVDQNRAVYGKVIYHNKIDTLLLEDASPFSIGDTVLFHHTISGFAYDSTAQIGIIANYENAGIYGIYLIEGIDGNYVKLNNVLPLHGSFAHRIGDYGQLIKVPTYERARFTSNFEFPAWNPNTKTGGIFPILVNKKLIIENDISGDGKGFKGANPSGDYVLSGGKCSAEGFSVDDNYFTSSATDSGAFKGETFCNNTGNGLEYMTRGRGFIGTGGGGGNALYSGGGGGSNKGTGGSGGDESDSCAIPGVMGGLKGHAVNYVTDPNNAFGNRIHMGGGGGTANQDPGRIASAGGSGGGIFIIIADTLEISGNRSLSASGASVTEIATAGAGGGGGGGVIVMDINSYTGNLLNLKVTGGKGGDVSGVPYKTGPGGGGGGGVIQHNGASLDPAYLNIDRVGGLSGKVITTGVVNNAFPGTAGERQGNLKIPILGFLFNSIPDDITVCQGELPPVLNAGSAKGASGTYNYLWYQSNDPTGGFVPASTARGPNNLQTYLPPLLEDTTYYKRLAEDKIKPTIFNLTAPMAINVHPRLEANYILADDTACFDIAPILPLTSDSILRGGDGFGYFFRWEKSENTPDSWPPPSEIFIDQSDYFVPAMETTTYYRRVVSSGACVNYSDTVKITVLPSIINNTISDNQILCNLGMAAPLNGEAISGGESTDKRYQWQLSTNGGSWSQIATTEDYAPGSLAANNYEYRRIALSGSENACIDISDTVSIIVYPDIASNSISTTVDTICSDLPTITLEGTIPTGGKINDYAYLWEISPNGTNGWTIGSGSPDTKDFQPGTLNSDTWFRRRVYSAKNDSACFNISGLLKIEVLPPITNMLTSPDATICQFTDSPQINGNVASGGLTGDYRYQWQIRENDMDWANTPIIFDKINYSPGVLTDTSYFRRVVFSGPNETCVDYSDSATVFVQPAIQFNEFARSDVQDTCFASEVVIPALAIAGGDGSKAYQWEQSINDGSNWLSASEAINNQQNYTLSSLVETIWYRRIATSGECIDTSDVKIINPQALPELLSITSSDNNICTTNDLFLLLNMKLKNTKLEVSYSDNFGGNFPDVVIDNDMVPIETLNDGIFEYTISRIKDENSCLSISTGSPVTVQIDKSLSAKINEADNNEVCGFSFGLSSILDSESLGAYSTVWEVLNPDTFLVSVSSDDNATFEPVAGISSNFTTLETEISFRQNTPVCQGIRDTVKVILYRPLDDIDISLPETKIMYFRDWDTITVFPDTIGVHFWELNEWALDQSAQIINPNANPVRIENVPITENKISGNIDNTTIVSYTLSHGVCPSRKLNVELIRNEVRVYEGISPNQSPGENDYLIAEGLKVEGLNSFTFQIFSSNGMMVRELTQDDVDDIVITSAPNIDDDALVIWDGKNSRGNNYVVPGTYYYVLVLDFKGLEFVDKGFVVVK